MRIHLFVVVVGIMLLYACNVRSQTKHRTMPLDSLRIAFSNDEDARLRLYLVQEYKPGNCFGMPTVDPPPRTQKKIDSTTFHWVKQVLVGKSDPECESAIRAMTRIILRKTAPGRYNFEFRDGRCCTITHYKGKLRIQKGQITKENVEQHLEVVPC